MADGRHIENGVMVIRYISTIYCSINAKFGTKKRNHAHAQIT